MRRSWLLAFFFAACTCERKEEPRAQPRPEDAAAAEASAAVAREKFPRPLEAFAELAVVTERPLDELKRLARGDEVAALLTTKHCGFACDEVRAFVRDGKAMTFEVRGPGEWVLPPADTLPIAARSLSDAERASIPQRKHTLVVRAHAGATANHLVARAGFGAAAAIASKLGALVYDEEVRRIENASQAEGHAITLALGAPVLRPDHIAIQVYTQSDGTARALTLGMRRFGAPDLEARGAAMHAGKALGALLDVVAAKIAAGEELTPMTIAHADLLRTDERARPVAKPVTIDLTTPPHTAGDPDNVMLSVTVPGSAPAREAFDDALQALFGKLDLVVDEASDPALLEVRKRARATMPAALARWKKDERSGAMLMVKLPFPYEAPEAMRDAGTLTEWMWVQVSSFDDASISGKLANSPAYATGLSMGSSVKGKRTDVADWLIKLPDGGIEGGESVRILEARAR